MLNITDPIGQNNNPIKLTGVNIDKGWGFSIAQNSILTTAYGRLTILFIYGEFTAGSYTRIGKDRLRDFFIADEGPFYLNGKRLLLAVRTGTKTMQEWRRQ